MTLFLQIFKIRWSKGPEIFETIFTTPCVSFDTCHMSNVMFHVSHVPCHVSCVPFFLFFVSGRFSWWRVCYQRGYPVYSLHRSRDSVSPTCRSFGYPVCSVKLYLLRSMTAASLYKWTTVDRCCYVQFTFSV